MCYSLSHKQWRRSQVKSGGGINIEKIEGVGSEEGLCPPQLGVWGLAPRKKIGAKNYAILSKFWYFFPILQQKVGDYPPVLKVGDLSPCPPPCSDAYAHKSQAVLPCYVPHFHAIKLPYTKINSRSRNHVACKTHVNDYILGKHSGDASPCEKNGDIVPPGFSPLQP